MIQKNDGQNVHLENASDADLKITLFPNVKKTPKYNKKRQKLVRFSKKGNHASQK